MILDEGASASLVATDHVTTVPLEFGVGLRVGKVGVDGAVTYTHAIGSELFGDAPTGFEESALTSWGLMFGVGVEL